MRGDGGVAEEEEIGGGVEAVEDEVDGGEWSEGEEEEEDEKGIHGGDKAEEKRETRENRGVEILHEDGDKMEDLGEVCSQRVRGF